MVREVELGIVFSLGMEWVPRFLFSVLGSFFSKAVQISSVQARRAVCAVVGRVYQECDSCVLVRSGKKKLLNGMGAMDTYRLPKVLCLPGI